MLNEFNLSIKYKIANNIMYFDIDTAIWLSKLFMKSILRLLFVFEQKYFYFKSQSIDKKMAL